MKNRRTNFDEFKAELLENPEVRAEYEALKPKYDMIASLIKRRNELKLSQADLARRLGMKQPAISRLENGDNATLTTFSKVVEALDLEVSLRTRKADSVTK